MDFWRATTSFNPLVASSNLARPTSYTKGSQKWTDPQKLDSFIRLAEGIEFGIEPDLIPLVFVWSDHGCSSGYIPLALF